MKCISHVTALKNCYLDILFLHKHISFLNWDLIEIWAILYVGNSIYCIYHPGCCVCLFVTQDLVCEYFYCCCLSVLMSWAQQFWLRHCLWKYPVLVTSVCHIHLSHFANNITRQSLSIRNLTSSVSVRNFHLL